MRYTSSRCGFAFSWVLAMIAAWSYVHAADKPPNIVLIFADDLGYGDLGCYGQKRWATPNIDSIARNGVLFTDFHSSQPVCSASRASLLTGCYANRIGIHGALAPASKNGIHENEVLLSELLQSKGYKTCAVGKWHLGHHQKFLPLQHGFDRYLGLPYSNDMWPHGPVVKAGTFPELPLIRDNEIIDRDVDAQDQSRLTEQYSNFALEFLEEAKDSPFFLYFAHSFPHVPLFAGENFRGKSTGGIYGDVLEEFDAVVGRILSFLKTNGLEENTLIIFSSDNGPWLTYGDHAGTAGPLREGKGLRMRGLPTGQQAMDAWKSSPIPETVIIVGPKHTRLGSEWAVSPSSSWMIPSSRGADTASFQIDLELSKKIVQGVQGMEFDAAAHMREHGAEVQLPVLDWLAGEGGSRPKLVCIAMANANWDEILLAAKQLAQVLRPSLGNLLFAISSDMNHFADDQENRRRDRMALDALAHGDPERLLEVCRSNSISMCGVIPAALVMQTLKELGIQTKVQELSYDTSASVSGDSSRVVGYAAARWIIDRVDH